MPNTTPQTGLLSAREVAEPRGIHRRINFELTASLLARFNAKVKRGSDSECWQWLGAQRNGYGAIKHCGKVLGSHVVAFVAGGGTIESEHIITHECDNRLCCNPAHLKLGTFQSNAREMWDRRDVNATRGEKHPNAILNESLVEYIHALRQVQKLGYVRISKLLGIKPETIKSVLDGKSWKHIVIPTLKESERLLSCQKT